MRIKISETNLQKMTWVEIKMFLSKRVVQRVELNSIQNDIREVFA